MQLRLFYSEELAPSMRSGTLLLFHIIYTILEGRFQVTYVLVRNITFLKRTEKGRGSMFLAAV